MKKIHKITIVLWIIFSCICIGCSKDIQKDYQVSWEWIIEPGKYKDIKLLEENLICVQDGAGKYGVLNVEKEQIIECQYKNILGINDGILRVIDMEGNYLFIDLQGNNISQETFQEANDFREGRAAVKKNDQWGFIDTLGNLVIDYQFDNVVDGFREKVAAVESNEEWLFIDMYGNLFLRDNYQQVYSFSEGYAAVKKNDQWGFVDKEGRLVIDFQYEEVGNFSEGKVAVMKNFDNCRKWAYVNTENDIVIDYELYDQADGRMEMVGEFHDGYSMVSKGVYCLIDSEGKVILGDGSYFLTGGSKYNSESDLLVAYDYVDQEMIQTKYGLINLDGEQKIPFVFNHISECKGNLATVLYEQNEISGVGVIRIIN